MNDDPATFNASTPIETGAVVYDHEGNELGVITGLTGEGFKVSINEDIEHIDEESHADIADPGSEQAAKTNEASLHSSTQKHNPGQEFGEGYLMWRCDNCGEMGTLEDGLPSECPDCGSANVYKWRED